MEITAHLLLKDSSAIIKINRKKILGEVNGQVLEAVLLEKKY